MKNRLFSGQVIPINRDNVDTDLIIQAVSEVYQKVRIWTFFI